LPSCSTCGSTIYSNRILSALRPAIAAINDRKRTNGNTGAKTPNREVVLLAALQAKRTSAAAKGRRVETEAPQPHNASP
jgi:hypothetical protein